MQKHQALLMSLVLSIDQVIMFLHSLLISAHVQLLWFSLHCSRDSIDLCWRDYAYICCLLLYRIHVKSLQIKIKSIVRYFPSPAMTFMPGS